jgi:hypothetical protein
MGTGNRFILRSGTNCVFLTLDQEKIPAPVWGTSQGRALARPTKATCLGNPGNLYIQTDIPDDTIWPYVVSKISKRQIITARSIESRNPEYCWAIQDYSAKRGSQKINFSQIERFPLVFLLSI